MSNHLYVVAKGKRDAKCRGPPSSCPHQNLCIKGQLRFGTKGDFNGAPTVFWRHLECVTARMLQGITADNLDSCIEFNCSSDDRRVVEAVVTKLIGNVAATATATSSSPSIPSSTQAKTKKSTVLYSESEEEEDDNEVPIVKKAKTAASPKPRRRCRYGNACYRVNPLHFQEFSHPWWPEKDKEANVCEEKEEEEEEEDDDDDEEKTEEQKVIVEKLHESGKSRRFTVVATYDELLSAIGFPPNATDMDDVSNVQASWGFKEVGGDQRLGFVWCYKYFGPLSQLTNWSGDGSQSLFEDMGLHVVVD